MDINVITPGVNFGFITVEHGLRYDIIHIQ